MHVCARCSATTLRRAGFDPTASTERRPPAPGEAPFRVQQHLQDEARRRASFARGRAGVVLQPEAAGH